MELTVHEYSFKSSSGLCDIYATSAVPASFSDVKGVVQIAHGMAEHSARYAEFAKALAERGYAVFINDHLGHGKSVASKEDLGFFGPMGYDALVKDMKQLTEIAKKEYPELPFIIFGHSMGSFLAREYTALSADNAAKAVLLHDRRIPVGNDACGSYRAVCRIVRYCLRRLAAQRQQAQRQQAGDHKAFQ